MSMKKGRNETHCALSYWRLISWLASSTPNTGKHAPTFLAGWHGTLALSFTSYVSMKTYLSREPPDPSIRAVVYDAEAWPLTPVAEQRDPARHAALAAALAHSAHLLLIATPATNLASVAASGDPL